MQIQLNSPNTLMLYVIPKTECTVIIALKQRVSSLLCVRRCNHACVALSADIRSCVRGTWLVLPNASVVRSVLLEVN